jgi:hypothetical protein
MESVMRNQKLILVLSCLAAIGFAATFVSAKPPISRKEQALTSEHGPWMIMAATFRDIKDSDRKTEGMSAEEAARTLVKELRDQGFPAYTYSQDSQKDRVETQDWFGNKAQRTINAKFDMICVLVGNYPKIDDEVAQKTLTYIKKFRPKYLDDKKNGAVKRDGAQGPFGGAFMTINPLRNPTEISRRKPDDETVYLNSGIDYALVKLKRKYTLKVATFAGKSTVPIATSQFAGRENRFDKTVRDSTSSLARAGEDATHLCYALRSNRPSNEQHRRANETLGFDRYEAYVYHDKFQSVVTIGGFDSPNDPAIKQFIKVFQAKYKKNVRGEYELTPTSLSLFDPNNNENSPPIQIWAFDPVPELIEVPQVR